jgi:hypothetical protein
MKNFINAAPYHYVSRGNYAANNVQQKNTQRLEVLTKIQDWSLSLLRKDRG